LKEEGTEVSDSPRLFCRLTDNGLIVTVYLDRINWELHHDDGEAYWQLTFETWFGDFNVIFSGDELRELQKLVNKALKNS
jgi:hypothetical protein